MFTILYLIAAFLYCLFYGTWLFYIAFMGIKTHRVMLKEKLGIVWYGLYPLFVVALLLDVLFNLIIGTLYYRELPKIFMLKFWKGEWLFTARCQRHLKGSGTKLRKAQFVCATLLDPFETGHCYE